MTSRVIVVGGGIAGSTLALALRTAGLQTTVVEARAAADDGGAVVRLNPNGMDALRAVGAHQAIIAVSFPLVRVESIGSDGRRTGYRLAAEPGSERGLPRVTAWPTLARTLRTEAVERGAVFRHDTRVTGATELVDGVRVTLDDGTHLEADVLVGADGARSATRRWIDPQAPAPQHCGTRTLYGFTPRPSFEPPPPEVLRAYHGARAFFAATRESSTGGCFWFTSRPAPALLTAGEATDVEAWRAHLSGVFDGDASPAARAVAEADRILAFDDHALEHLPRWHTDRMIVIGDAAHVAPPASEQGAAIGMEDGVVLARCLRDEPDTARALATFEHLRRERVEAVVALGLRGTSAAHRHGVRRRVRRAADRVRTLARGSRPAVGGPAWAFEHHIDWGG